MIKKEWFWMLNPKKQNEEYCHYSGLPSPMAYESKKIKNNKKKNERQGIIIITSFNWGRYSFISRIHQRYNKEK